MVALLLASPAQAQLRGHGGPVRALAISADGKTAVSGSFDSSAIRWSLARNAAERVLRFHESAVNAVALAPEHYDFLLVESHRDRPAGQAFLAALRDPKTRERIRALGMQPAD